MKCIVIDDEPKSREVLVELIGLFCPGLEVIGEAGNIRDSVRLIKDKQPELVFFDILLQEGDSFEIIKNLEEVNFEMIFVTAFDEDSVKALKFSGARVLLKPIQIQELVDSVKAVKRKKGNSYLTYKMAKGMLKSKLSKIPVVTTEGLEFYPISEVLYIKRSGKGSKIFFKNRLQTSSDRSLNEFQSFIDSERFQFLESYLVNGDEIMDNDRVIKRLRFQNGEILNYML